MEKNSLKPLWDGGLTTQPPRGLAVPNASPSQVLRHEEQKSQTGNTRDTQPYDLGINARARENISRKPLWDGGLTTQPPRGLAMPNASPSQVLRHEEQKSQTDLGINARARENISRKPLWDGGQTTPPRELRMPNTSPSQVLRNEEQKSHKGNTGDMSPYLDINPPKKFQLSAEAPEFIPKGFSNQSAYMLPTASSGIGSSVQDRLKKARGVVEQPPTQHNEDGNDFINSPDDIRLQHLISTLTKDPGQFVDLLDLFMDTLSPYFNNINVIPRAAQLLVGQAINFPSFRYTAAKLCCFLEDYCPIFRAELHLTCKTELDKNPNKSGLVLFVAELYTQLYHENIYGSFLIDAFKHLLTVGENDDVKYICQALKLTGYSLEKYNSQALNEVFAQLEEKKPNTSGTALNLLISVINLRNSNWGRSGTQSNSSSVGEPEVPFWGEPPSNPVFYNMDDGSQFTTEETDFLAAHLNSTEEFGTDLSDPDELCDPEPEMDEEIQAAFKDFVKLSKR